jgi:sugar phosphate isomerase/epimerase
MASHASTIPDPKSMDGTDIVLNYFSLDRHLPIEDRLAAASASGLTAIGLYIGQYKLFRESGRSAAELTDMLTEAGLCIAEIEVLAGWCGNDAARERAKEQETLAWEMADAFGCRYVQSIGPYAGTIAEAGHLFGGLCDRAADHGLVVGLEFLPFTNIVTAADAQHIVETAARPNGGLCVDIWHHTRGANDLSMLTALPGELVTGIQINDGALTPEHDDYYTDCLINRRPPGEGEFDLQSFIRTLDGIGANVPWGLEVCSTEGWTTDDRAGWTSRCVNGLRAALADARSA